MTKLPADGPGATMSAATPDAAHVIADLCAMLERHNANKIPLDGNTNLTSDLNVDSVEIMDLIMEIEDKYNIDVPINLLADVEKINDLAAIIVDRIKGA
jgi:acyl carrier protein